MMKPPTKTSDTDHYLLGMDEASLRRYRLFNSIYQPATEQRFATLSVEPHMKILEVGCGIGQTACYMAQRIVPDGQVVAFDQSSALVEIASRHALENGIKNVAFHCAKAEDFDFGAEIFDLIHTRYVLSYSPFAKEILRRIHRSLKAGGLFFGEEIYQTYVRHHPPPWFGRLTGWFAKLIEAGGGHPNYGLDQMPSDMSVAGFRALQVTAVIPVQDQEAIVEMLRLALSHEMKQSLLKCQLATSEEIDATVAEMTSVPAGALISASTVVQVTGARPAPENPDA